MPIIYEPKGKAREYSDLAANLYKGCSHGCTYCYAPACLYTTREKFTKDVIARNNIISQLKKDCIKYQKEGDTREVLLSFTSDCYQPLEKELNITREAIALFNEYGVKHKILTKNKLVKRDIDILSKENCKIGMTIVFDDDNKRMEYEPGASTIQERIKTLKEFKKAGFYTWVSVEPVIDPYEALKVIKKLDFVDMIKVGKLNHVKNDTDWKLFYHNVVDLLESMGIDYYIKKDLEKYK